MDQRTTKTTSMNQRQHPWLALLRTLLVLVATSVHAQQDTKQDFEQVQSEMMQLIQQGRAGRAVTLGERTLATAQRTLPANDRQLKELEASLMHAYMAAGRMDKAMERAGVKVPQAPPKPGQPPAAKGPANCYAVPSDYMAAMKCFGKMQERRALAEEYVRLAASQQQAEQIVREFAASMMRNPPRGPILAEDPAMVAMTTKLDALIETPYRVNVETEEALRKELANRERTLGPEDPATAAALHNLAEVYYATGRYEQARDLWVRAVAINEKVLGRDHELTGFVLNSLADLHRATGAYDAWQSASERLQALAESNRVLFLVTGSDDSKRKSLRLREDRLDSDASLSVARPSARSAALGLTSVLQYKGRVLDAAVRLRTGGNPQDQPLFDDLARIAREYSALSLRGPADTPSDAYRKQLAALRQQYEKQQAAVAQRSIEVGQRLSPITLEGVRAALPTDAVLVELLRYRPFLEQVGQDTQWGPPRYVAYALERSGSVAAIDLGEARTIDLLVLEFRRALTDPTAAGRGQVSKDAVRLDIKRAALNLSDRLVKPLRRHLQSGKRLLIAADKELNLIPFAALLDEQGDYLGRRFEISYLTSGTDLLRLAKVTAPRGAAVVLADPDFGDSTPAPGRPKFDRLPGTAAEAQALRALLELSDAQLLTGKRATETGLRALHGPKILHLATHGFYLGADALPPDARPSMPSAQSLLLRSGVALAGANRPRPSSSDDGVLTAFEAAQLDLRGTQLVVLSSCETALGVVDAAEGIYGLRRALTLAGAQTQLVSLWKVDDRATVTLMTNYYRRLLQGAGRSAALREAQLAMLANPAYQHPYFWAAFIPIGNWRPIDR